MTVASGSAGEEPEKVALDNGTAVRLFRSHRVCFPDGETGLVFDYVTDARSEHAIQNEYRFAWWGFIPRIRASGDVQGLVRAFARLPKQGEHIRATGIRACLTEDGHTLWMTLDGRVLDAASGRHCAKRATPPPTECAERIERCGAEGGTLEIEPPT
jgi:hypothetical protein